MAKSQKSTTSFDFKNLHIRLAEADMVFWLMPFLIVLLVVGTIAQRWVGLYEAHQTYFASFIIWLGPIPLPGGYIILGFLTLNLTMKFLFKSEWSAKKSGIILSHLGALILLIGGLITSIVAEERYMVLSEGAQTPFIYHYTERNLMIFEDERELLRLPYDQIEGWGFGDLPFEIDVISSCDNCEIYKREESPDYSADQNYGGMAQFMALKPKPVEKEPEANLAGLEFYIRGTDLDDGRYISFDGMPKSIEFDHDGKSYAIIFGKDQKSLPFAVKLVDFVKDDYEATSMARGYHSDVVILDGDIQWDTRIEMNKPLRYKGYTFFQSSFDQTGQEEISVFSVVKNEGWLFPYIGTLTLGLGLIVHIIIVFRQRRRA